MPGIQFPTTDTGLSDKNYFSEQTCRGSEHYNDTLNDFQETRMKKHAFGVLRKKYKIQHRKRTYAVAPAKSDS